MNGGDDVVSAQIDGVMKISIYRSANYVPT